MSARAWWIAVAALALTLWAASAALGVSVWLLVPLAAPALCAVALLDGRRRRRTLAERTADLRESRRLLVEGRAATGRNLNPGLGDDVPGGYLP